MVKPLLLEEVEGTSPRFFFKNLSLRSHFEVQNSIFYNLNLKLSKVRHSNTLFLTVTFAFPGSPLGALVRFPCVCVCGGGGGGGGGGQLKWTPKKKNWA